MRSPFVIIRWLFRRGFVQGAIWAIVAVFFGSLCDVIMRVLGEDLHFTEIIFFRFFFGLITIFPLIYSHGITSLRTNRIGLHIVRIILGVGAFFADCYGVLIMALNEYTIFVSCQPLFFLPLAFFFLREKVTRIQIEATLLGFIGMLVIQNAGPEALKLAAWAPITGALLFALLDLFTKKMVSTESTYNLLFYFSIGTTLVSLIPAMVFWQTPTVLQWGLLILLGLGATVMQFCLIKSFMATEAATLMPLRYLYFIFSIILGYLFFSEIPLPTTLLGAFFIIIATYFVSYKATK